MSETYTAYGIGPDKYADELQTLRDERDRLKREKDGAYLERNRVVAALAKLFPSGIARTAIEGWSEDWHGCVYIDLPTGQVSWHYHDSHAHLFAGIPPYPGTWDGHSTEEKYQRVTALTPAGQRWTKRKPTQAGWYWFREKKWIGAEVVCVEQPHGPDTDYLEVWDGPLDEFHSDECEWQGPLTPNEETE